MRKILRIIGISTGIISVVSVIVLGYIYMEDIIKHLKSAKGQISNKIK